jgi:hypothetical protein
MGMKKVWRWLSVAVVMSLALPIAGMTVQADSVGKPASPQVEKRRPMPFLGTLPTWAELHAEPETAPLAADRAPPPTSSPRLSSVEPAAHTAPRTYDALRATAEVFTNTWSYNTLGLVYDPGRDHVRYAHESESSTSNPTVYDVDRVSHSAVFSFALSAVNSGWPWQIDNRNGVGYDFFADTYFLPDYNGDLTYADDNIVEVTLDGTILNAWEMDDEVGSNDSSDGSEINSIVDIAVVPGSPTRYFATAAFDSNVVYEIELSKTGTWWTPNSWRTVATCTVPGLTDNVGIDYDAENDVLYHSDYYTTTLVVTDLGCSGGQPMHTHATFDCPGAGGFNTGVTFIEGSVPPTVWVTDWSSDQTTICPSPYGGVPPEPGWEKWVLDPASGATLPWNPDLVITAQTSDTIVVVDVITSVSEFILIEMWDPGHLTLVDWNVTPPVGDMNYGDDFVEFIFPPGPPEVITITKWFHVETCNWTDTVLFEELIGVPVELPIREVRIEKMAPQLQITSDYDVPVAAGNISSFTLIYSNTGGFESDAMIINTFPITAPFAFSEPLPDEVYPDGSVEWQLGSLATDDLGAIDVYFFVDETVVPSSTIQIWDGIYDHAGTLIDWVVSEFHVTEGPPPIEWEKLVNGEPWFPGIAFRGEVSDTFVVEDVIVPLTTAPFTLIEEWDPNHIQLEGFVPPPYGNVITGDGFLIWEVPDFPFPPPEPIILTKFFHIEPCTWEGTILWEELWIDGYPEPQIRPVDVFKIPPLLWIENNLNGSPEVYGGELVSFTLTYGNDGGVEPWGWISNTFPAEAPFVWSDPPPMSHAADGSWALWPYDDLRGGDVRQITVTVEIARGLPPSTTVDIYDYILDHAWREWDWTRIRYHIAEPEWWKSINGQPWDPGIGIPVYTSDTITVSDIIYTGSDFNLVEFWNPEHLTLQEVIVPSGIGAVVQEPGYVEWVVDDPPLEPLEIIKIFHVEPCTWTYTVLWEELWVEGIDWERRPVQIDKPEIELMIDSFFDVAVMPGQQAVFELEYANSPQSDVEAGAWISNTFPAEAPFAGSIPEPTFEGDDWVVWELPELAPGETGIITVFVDIDPTLVPSDTIEIWDGIYNHMGELEDWTLITYHVPPPVWHKWVNGEPWYPGMAIPVYTSDTITITEVVYTVPEAQMTQPEFWDPEHLVLLDWQLTGGYVEFDPAAGFADWILPVTPEIGVYTLTKWFHVEPCIWTETTLWEELWVDGQERESRNVFIEKPPTELWIDSFFDVYVMAGEQVTFELEYTNPIIADREFYAEVVNTFPPEARFAGSIPDPDESAADGSWAVWALPPLEPGESGIISVSVNISPTLPPGTVIEEIWDGIFNHAGELEDDTVITFTVEPPEPAWAKEIWIDDTMYGPDDTPFPVAPDEVVTIVDRVWITNGAAISFTLTEEWSAEMTLDDVEYTDGSILSGTGWLDWYGYDLAPNTWHVITKTFQFTSTEWMTSTVTETLTVRYVEPLEPVILEFPLGERYIYLPLVLKNF